MQKFGKLPGLVAGSIISKLREIIIYIAINSNRNLLLDLPFLCDALMFDVPSKFYRHFPKFASNFGF